jgi:hypothetical protein
MKKVLILSTLICCRYEVARIEMPNHNFRCFIDVNGQIHLMYENRSTSTVFTRHPAPPMVARDGTSARCADSNRQCILNYHEEEGSRGLLDYSFHPYCEAIHGQTPDHCAVPTPERLFIDIAPGAGFEVIYRDVPPNIQGSCRFGFFPGVHSPSELSRTIEIASRQVFLTSQLTQGHDRCHAYEAAIRSEPESGK